MKKKSRTSYVGSVSRYVGVGASAGGIDALRELLSEIKQDYNLAIVIIQHLPPQYESALVHILSRETSLRVKTAENAELVEANTVYIAPPNSDVKIERGHLIVVELNKKKDHIPHPNVDTFLTSLAIDQEDKAIGVVLSGTGKDGRAGMQKIKECGGIVIAQNEESSKFFAMPSNVIRDGIADFIANPKDIAHRLEKLAELADKIHIDPESQRDFLKKLYAHFKKLNQVDFTNYKTNMILRRCKQRMQTLDILSADQYLEYIEKNEEEIKILHDGLLIHVTKFFRDRDAFRDLQKVLKKTVDAHLKEPDHGVFRVWVAGCSTGEEAYSIAIILTEIQPDLNFEIFATDVYAPAIDYCRKGVYVKDSIEDCPPDILTKYFLRTKDNKYAVSKDIRKNVIFSRHDLIKDPVFTKMHLISCRNLLIYFDTILQERILNAFHYCLCPDGILFLGKSENIDRYSKYFSDLYGKSRIFKKNNVESRYQRLNPLNKQYGSKSPPIRHEMPRSTFGISDEDKFRVTLSRKFSPTAILLDSEYNVLQTNGNVKDYIAVKEGRFDSKIISLAKTEYKPVIRALIYECQKKKIAVSVSIKTKHKSKKDAVKVSVFPYVPNGHEIPHAKYILTFEQTEAEETVAPKKKAKTISIKENRELIKSLEQENHDLKSHLQSIVEQLETSSQELQLANEELQASNEELQTSNEELEAANEELQSTNEELITVNDELKNKTDELERSLDDLENTMNSFDSAIIVLDADYKVRRANNHALKLFNIENQSDVSKLIHHIDHIELLKEIRDNFNKSRNFEKFLKIKDKPFQFKMINYPVGPDEQSAILIFNDISKLLDTENLLEERREKLSEFASLQKAILDSALASICLIDKTGKILATNKAWEVFYDENGGDPIFAQKEQNYLDIVYAAEKDMILSGRQMTESIAQKIRDVLNGKVNSSKFEYPCHSPTKHRWFLCTITPVKNEEGVVSGAVIMHEDVTDRKLWEEKILQEKSQSVELDKRKTLFLANLSHELRTPLNAILGFSDLLLEKRFEDDNVEQYIRNIQEGASYLESIVKRILDMAKLQSGTLMLREEMVRPEDIFNISLRMIKQLYPTRQIEFHMTKLLETTLVKCDKNLTIEVVTNLIINALKYSNHDTAVNVNIRNNENGDIVFEVIDRGYGMDASEIEVALEPFGQNLRHTSAKSSGLGLGLPFSLFVSEIHGGTLLIHSKRGEGTRVEVCYPKKRLYSHLKEEVR